MGEYDFQKEVIDRLARIETKQDMHGETVAEQGKTIAQHSILIEGVCNSSRSAHKRIDSIYYAAGVIGGIAGWLADKLAALWGGKGGG